MWPHDLYWQRTMALASNIEDLQDRIDFLLKEKIEFNKLNKGEYADPVLWAFDQEIYRCEIKIAHQRKETSSANQGNNDNERIGKSNSQKKRGRPEAHTQRLSEYLICNDPDMFCEKLKEEFSKESPKGIALMILALEDMSPAKIKMPTRKEIYRAIHQYFEIYIGSDSTKNRIIANRSIYKAEIEKFQQRIGTLLNKNSLR
jgi:hypothetical protein